MRMIQQAALRSLRVALADVGGRGLTHNRSPTEGPEA